MFECHLRSFTDLNLVDSEYCGFERVVCRSAPAFGNRLDSAYHTDNRSYGRAVAVGVKSGFDSHADRLAVVAVSVKKSGCDAEKRTPLP